MDSTKGLYYQTHNARIRVILQIYNMNQLGLKCVV